MLLIWGMIFITGITMYRRTRERGVVENNSISRQYLSRNAPTPNP